MNQKNDETLVSKPAKLISCKTAAGIFGCSVYTVKNWAKKKEIEATQDGERKPYLVNHDELEAKLKASPGVLSIFHSKKKAEGAEPPLGEEAPSKPDHQEQKAVPIPETPKEVNSPEVRDRVTTRPPREPKPVRKVSTGSSQEKRNGQRKPDLRHILNQAKRLPLGDKVRLKNEMGRLIDAA